MAGVPSVLITGTGVTQFVIALFFSRSFIGLADGNHDGSGVIAIMVKPLKVGLSPPAAMFLVVVSPVEKSNAVKFIVF